MSCLPCHAGYLHNLLSDSKLRETHILLLLAVCSVELRLKALLQLEAVLDLIDLLVPLVDVLLVPTLKRKKLFFRLENLFLLNAFCFKLCLLDDFFLLSLKKYLTDICMCRALR